jgi:oligopeptide/dipeptide ABC transporter ATP-binding protein
MNDALLRVLDLRVELGGRTVLGPLSFDLFAGETLGLVGESGSGKTTLARSVLRLLRPSSGRIEFEGVDLLACDSKSLHARRRDLQMVFQDPLASLDSRVTIGESVAEPLKIFEPGLKSAARRQRVVSMLEWVGLRPDMMPRYPHEFSGGQCQRIAIARAVILNPRLLVCDEVVSSLDVSIQGQITNLLLDLQRDSGLAMLFISHNLAIVRHLSHRVMIVYAGRSVEIAAVDTLFAAPVHPYTRSLLAAIPAGLPAAGAAASRTESTGCAYRNRCPYAIGVCEAREPPLAEVGAGHFVACHRSHETLNPLSFHP